MAGVILAGGKGERLGGPCKALQPLGGRPLLEWVIERIRPLFPELILVTNRPDLYPSFPGRVVTDLHPHRGPLGGIEAGLFAARDSVNFVTGCDMPFLNRKLIARMQALSWDYDIVIPRLGHYVEPLHAFYSRRVFDLVREQLQAGKFKLSTLLAAPLKVCYFNEDWIKEVDPELLSFFNVNTPADLARAEEFLLKDGESEAHNYF